MLIKLTIDYYKVIQFAFEINLSVAILRISGGHWRTCVDVTSHIHTSKSTTSMDSGIDGTIRCQFHQRFFAKLLCSKIQTV